MSRVAACAVFAGGDQLGQIFFDVLEIRLRLFFFKTLRLVLGHFDKVN